MGSCMHRAMLPIAMGAHIQVIIWKYLVLQFLDYPSRIMRVEGHVNDLYVIYMTACLILFYTKFLFTILLNHIQHIYYVYGISYMQVTSIEQICSHNIWHYAVETVWVYHKG